MSLITDTWRQLVRRRLWPVAVLLLGALVAVPMLLAKSPAPAPAASAPAKESAAPAGGGLQGEPLVALADDSSSARRHVLGSRKDPFAPAPQPTASPTATPAGQGGATTVTTQTGSHLTIDTGSGSSGFPTSSGVSTGGGSVSPIGGGTVTPTTPTTPTTPSAPKPKPLARGTLTVRWGDASSDTLTTMHVKRLDALPDADHPVAIYLGPGKAKHSAVFLVDATVTPEGDGRCLPSDADCQRVEVRKGDTEFFTVTDSTNTAGSSDATSAGTQFELQLADIAGGKAKASRAHGAKATRAHASHARVTIARVVRLLHP